jgi:hypothetical protein
MILGFFTWETLCSYDPVIHLSAYSETIESRDLHYLHIKIHSSIIHGSPIMEAP